MQIETAFLFDLDGTLVDSVYQHVLSWKEVLDAEGMEISIWRIHRKIGMSGGLFTNQLLRETGVEISRERVRTVTARPCRGLPPPRGYRAPAAGCARAALMADRRPHPLGDCDQRPNGDGLRQSWFARG